MLYRLIILFLFSFYSLYSQEEIILKTELDSVQYVIEKVHTFGEITSSQEVIYRYSRIIYIDFSDPVHYEIHLDNYSNKFIIVILIRNTPSEFYTGVYSTKLDFYRQLIIFTKDYNTKRKLLKKGLR